MCFCSQNVKKYNKHKHTFLGMPPPTTWQLQYKPLDLIMILKNATKWSYIFETTKYFREYCCEYDRRSLLYIQIKSFLITHIVLEGSINFYCHYKYNLALSHMTAYITLTHWLGFGGPCISSYPHCQPNLSKWNL